MSNDDTGPAPTPGGAADSIAAAPAAIEWAVEWSPPDRSGARWIPGGQAVAMLQAPPDAGFVVVELYARGPLPTPVRLVVGNCWTGRTPGYGPYLDVGVRLAPGRWQTLAFPLFQPAQPGEKIAASIALDLPDPN